MGIQRIFPRRIGLACLCMNRAWLSNFLWGFLLNFLETLPCHSCKFPCLERSGFHIPAIRLFHHVLETDCFESHFCLSNWIELAPDYESSSSILIKFSVWPIDDAVLHLEPM